MIDGGAIRRVISTVVSSLPPFVPTPRRSPRWGVGLFVLLATLGITLPALAQQPAVQWQNVQSAITSIQTQLNSLQSQITKLQTQVTNSGTLPAGATACQALFENAAATAPLWATLGGSVTPSLSSCGQLSLTPAKSTVAALPVCNATADTTLRLVTDGTAASCIPGGVVTGGSTSYCLVVCQNGTGWVGQ